MGRRALFGNTALFDRRVGTESRLRSGSLMCFQERSYDARAEVRLWGTGDVRFILPAREEEERGGMGLPVVVEEVVASRLAAAVGYAAWLLNHIRSEERRVGEECVSTVRSRGSPNH